MAGAEPSDSEDEKNRGFRVGRKRRFRHNSRFSNGNGTAVQPIGRSTALESEGSAPAMGVLVHQPEFGEKFYRSMLYAFSFQISAFRFLDLSVLE